MLSPRKKYEWIKVTGYKCKAKMIRILVVDKEAEHIMFMEQLEIHRIRWEQNN